MYIEPNTTIKLYNGVPLDSTYVNTLYFSSLSAQNAYFHGTAPIKYTLTKQSYQRVERGKMRIEKKAEDLYDCNYLAFNNANFGSKWFYAFITGVEYVSNSVSEVTFEIDSMQTYFFDVTLKDSFVEREHSATDVAGDNVIAEKFEIKDYFYDTSIETATGYFDVLRPVLLTSYMFIGGMPTLGQTYNGIISDNGCCLYAWTYSGSFEEAMLSLRADLFMLEDAGKLDGVAGVYVIPASFAPVTEQPRQQLPTHVSPLTFSFPYDGSSVVQTRIGDYTPRNKKLLTYPYKKLRVETFEGNSSDYAYEFFSDKDNIEFDIYGNLSPNTSFKCVPKNYKGASRNFSETTVLSNFPMVAFSSNPFKEWYAQNKTRIAIQGIEGLLGAMGGIGPVIAGSQMLTPKTQVLSKAGAKMMASGINQSAGGTASTIGGIISEATRAHALPSTPRGSTDGSLEISCGNKDFNFIPMSMNEQYAEVIDNYFDKYGYATHRMKVPNRNVRPHWCYTKTIGCELIGNAPVDDIDKICSIYDNGITFWKNPSEVGNYSLDNTV